MLRPPVPRCAPAGLRVALSADMAPAALLAGAAAPAAADEVAERTRQLHDDATVIDTHVDTAQRLLRADWSFSERHQPPDPAGH
jgi:hypothetical protein